MRAIAVGNVVQQLSGGFERGVGAWLIESIVLEQATGFAFDAGECLAQCRRPSIH
jgi:hypothetical protein